MFGNDKSKPQNFTPELFKRDKNSQPNDFPDSSSENFSELDMKEVKSPVE